MQLRLLQGEAVLDVAIPKGASAQRAVAIAVSSGVEEPEWLMLWGLRWSGQEQSIKAGTYELERGITPRRLLEKLVRGEQATRSITLLEGWTFAQFRNALARAEHLKADSAHEDAKALMARLGRPGVHPEGRFFPDTYVYPKGSSDMLVLQQALQAMDRQLEDVWAQRAPGLPLRSPDQALTLASLVEKETGQPSERALVAGVFINRLRLQMRLQTDPAVIYGVGPEFEGRLRRKHLDTDTPYNTYTRAGLPPTPIAMPGRAALMAAVRPATTTALYFVARGDGTSQFSDTLDQHNRAVRRYILSRP